MYRSQPFRSCAEARPRLIRQKFDHAKVGVATNTFVDPVFHPGLAFPRNRPATIAHYFVRSVGERDAGRRALWAAALGCTQRVDVVVREEGSARAGADSAQAQRKKYRAQLAPRLLVVDSAHTSAAEDHEEHEHAEVEHRGSQKSVCCLFVLRRERCALTAAPAPLAALSCRKRRAFPTGITPCTLGASGAMPDVKCHRVHFLSFVPSQFLSLRYV